MKVKIVVMTMSEPRRPLERVFFSPAAARVLDHLVIHQEYDYSESEIARRVGLSFKTVSNVLKTLEREGLVKQTRISGQAKMYRVQDCNSIQGQKLLEFHNALCCVT